MLNAINWKLKYGFIAIVIGVIVLIMSIPKAIKFMSDPIKVDSVEKAMALKEGDHVLIDITMSDGYYMTYEEDGKETARYYIATFLDVDNLVDYGLTVRVGKDYYSNMERATDACEDFFDKWYQDMTTPVPTEVYLSIDGVIEEFSKSDEKKYAKEFVDSGYMSYLYVVPNGKSATKGLVIVGGVITLVGAVLIVLYILGRNKDKARLAELQASNPNYYQAPSNVTFNNSASNYTPYGGFDPSTDPRFNGMASGNPTGANQGYNQGYAQGYDQNQNQGFYQDPNQAQIPQNQGQIPQDQGQFPQDPYNPQQ